jgi:hypothetical protein
MLKRALLSGVAILIAWTVLDLILHRYYFVTFTLIAVFVATYILLVRPKSLRAGVAFGAFIGLALGISAGFGTYIHMPVPLTLAWGWFIGGWLKGVAAGAIVGQLVTDSPDHKQRTG